MNEPLDHEREMREAWEKAHTAVHATERIALDKAEASVAAKLVDMNELRTQINTERGVYPTREYVDAVFSSIDTRLKALENSKSYVIGWVAAAVMAGTLVMYILSRKP